MWKSPMGSVSLINSSGSSRASRRRGHGNFCPTRLTRNTTGNSSPLALCTVRTWTAGLSKPASAPGAPPAAVLDLALFLRGRLGVARHVPRILEELVEELAGGHLARQLHVALQVLEQLPDGEHPLRGHPVSHLGNLVEATQDVVEPAVPAVGVGGAAGEVHDGDLVEIRRGQVVEADRVVGVSHRAEEGGEQTDLGAAVEAGGAREGAGGSSEGGGAGGGNGGVCGGG